MYKGVAEFALHLDSFRNIDLYHQGVYAVRFRIYQEINNEVLHLSLLLPFIESLCISLSSS